MAALSSLAKASHLLGLAVGQCIIREFVFLDRCRDCMKTIEVDEELYRYIARQTQHIGESASEILRRLLGVSPCTEELPESQLPSDTMPVTPVEPERIIELQDLLASSELAARESAIDRFMLILS